MNLNNLHIALISPLQNTYSETFIQAHKQFLDGKIYYYYGGEKPIYLEGYGKLLTPLKKVKYHIENKFRKNTLSFQDRAIIASFKNNNITVVLAEYGTTGARMTTICKQLSIPLIVHFHGYDACKAEVLKVYKEAYKTMFEYASFVIAVSRVMEKDLLALGCPKHKLVYNVYGPKDFFLKLKPKYAKKQFIAVGRFTEKKAPQLTISAFNDVVKKHKDALLFMAGNGELLDQCKLLVKQLKLEQNVKFLGVIKQEEFLNYLEESVAFVQHSVTAKSGDKEGTPVAILEASAAGLPIISTIHAGIPDVIIHNKTGLLSKEHDVEAMYKNMLQLLDNPNLAKEMGLKGKQYIKNNFTLKKHIDTLSSIISKA